MIHTPLWEIRHGPKSALFACLTSLVALYHLTVLGSFVPRPKLSILFNWPHQKGLKFNHILEIVRDFDNVKIL